MKIRAWWLNRVLLYWIPMVFIYYSIGASLQQDVGSATTNAAVAALTIVFFEQFLFGYEIDLTMEALSYSEGFLLKKKCTIERRDIEAASFLQTPVLNNVQSARLSLTVRDGREFVLSLAAFRPADVAKIVKWLPVKPA